MSRARPSARSDAASRRPQPQRRGSSGVGRPRRAGPGDDSAWRECLIRHGIQVSAPRLAIASYVLGTTDHPSADQVHQRMRERGSSVSRATVYNTLALFERVGILRRLVLSPGCVVFDPKLERHHHLIDRESGRIWDVATSELEEAFGSAETSSERPGTICLSGSHFEVDEVQTVLLGRQRLGAEARGVTEAQASRGQARASTRK